MSYKKGDLVRIVDNLSSGHGYTIGETYKVFSSHYVNSSNPYWILEMNGVRGTWSIKKSEIAPAFTSRKEEGEFMLEEATKLIIKAKEMELKAKALMKYKDDEEELADIISQCFKKNGDKTAIAKLLRKSNIVKK